MPIYIYMTQKKEYVHFNQYIRISITINFKGENYKTRSERNNFCEIVDKTR